MKRLFNILIAFIFLAFPVSTFASDFTVSNETFDPISNAFSFDYVDSSSQFNLNAHRTLDLLDSSDWSGS